jgi:hypothetical protein
MSERDEVRRRGQAFKAHQERLTSEREARMNTLTQQIRQTLSEMRQCSASPLRRRTEPFFINQSKLNFALGNCAMASGLILPWSYGDQQRAFE